MAKQTKNFTRKKYHQKIDQTELTAKEVKILNTEPDELQGTDFNILVLNVRTTANAFKSALKKLKFKDDNCEINKFEKKEIIKELADIENMIKLKILSIKKGEINKTKGESLKELNTHSSTQSFLSFQSELTDKTSSSPKCTGYNFVDSKSEAFSISKLKSLSKQSLCSTKSSQCDYLDVDDFDIGDGDDVNDKKFKEFILKVNCPFCSKVEDNKDSLAKHLDTSCSAFKTQIFVQSLDCPYSVFQLLPNNAFKCNICPDSVHSNLRKYFMHSQSAIHISGLNKVASRKNFTDLIFCASCKIQIPNNATQLLFHLTHEVHKSNRKEQPSSHFFKQRGIQCVYSKEKKFKCLNCPPGKSIHKTVKEILGHVESEAHVKPTLSQKSRPSTYTMFCMFCREEINVFCVLGHFSSSEHAHKVEEESNNKFQLCYYCGFKCSKLLELAQHTRVCLDKTLQKDNHPKNEELDKVLEQVEKEQERPTKENTSEKGRCIIVKGCPKVHEVCNYFKQFGEVLDIVLHGENSVMIKYQKEKSVDDILESGKPIEINGVKLKITRKEDLDRSDVKVESSRAADDTNPFLAGSNDGSDLASTSRDDFDVSNPIVEDFSNTSTDRDTLESLFNRVSSHLWYTALKPDCEDFLSIAGDCKSILKLVECHAVGFLKCGLSFPVEEITLYCEMRDSFFKEKFSGDKSTSLTESILFNENLCEKSVSLFKNTDAVSRVKLRGKSFPLVEFYHNKTQKLCTITFRECDNILADELRYCLKDNQKLSSFVLIIRFWLSVHRLEVRKFESMIISLLLFFLLSSDVATPSEDFRQKLKHVLFNYSRRDQGSRAHYKNMRKNYSIVDLFQNFLLFLNEFDFENMAICLPFLYPVPKTSLSQEPLKKYLCKWFNPDAPVWIMDPFLFNNVAMDVNKVDWDSLLTTVRQTVEYYHFCAET